ncbi:MAG: NAD-dependent epimerase/dehydratase family protein [Bacteroidaceae bacterium]|nr:NAD-dependent epimerase/dehydratase family protein [Bacteroidaceae bacterium]
MKKILILGGFGFIGTNIMKYIEKNYGDAYGIIVFDKCLTHPHGVECKQIVASYEGDFSDTVLLERIFDENKVDLVIHALSTTIPSMSFNAVYDVETNLIPTLNLMREMINHHVRDIVYVSSGGAVYGDFQKGQHTENEAVYPISSYGVVKLAVEKYLMQYSIVYGLRPLILRLSNPYGPYHYSMKQGICNVAMMKALKNEIFDVWGDGSAKKDYIYVQDFVVILFMLLEKGVTSQVINVGSGEVVSVNDVLAKVKGVVPDFQWRYVDALKSDVPHFELDTSLLHSFIGNYDFVSLDEGICLTFSWAKTIC